MQSSSLEMQARHCQRQPCASIGVVQYNQVPTRLQISNICCLQAYLGHPAASYRPPMQPPASIGAQASVVGRELFGNPVWTCAKAAALGVLCRALRTAPPAELSRDPPGVLLVRLTWVLSAMPMLRARIAAATLHCTEESPWWAAMDGLSLCISLPLPVSCFFAIAIGSLQPNTQQCRCKHQTSTHEQHWTTRLTLHSARYCLGQLLHPLQPGHAHSVRYDAAFGSKGSPPHTCVYGFWPRACLGPHWTSRTFLGCICLTAPASGTAAPAVWLHSPPRLLAVCKAVAK
jgi:hypothetical protein